MIKRMTGVLSPVVTPFKSDLTPDPVRLERQCRWLLDNKVGLAVFGTNSEANSLSADERMRLLDYLVASGLDPARMMPGTGCCSITDSVRLTAHAVKLGCAGVLMLPPFYYKGVPDEGLYRNYAEIIDRVADDRLQVYLYHIPQVSQVSISLNLIERLLKNHPKSTAGIKDSSGDWNNTKALLDAFAGQDFHVFAGSESFLLANMRNGGAGCISATANVNPAAIHTLYSEWETAGADAQQDALNVIRNEFQKYPMISALKVAVAHWSGDADWRRVRPPLVELTAQQGDELVVALKGHGFSMPGLAEVFKRSGQG